MQTGRSHARTLRARRGAAMVEMALVLPVFITLMLGIIEFGRAIMVGQLVTNSAREAARLAILDGSTNTDVTSAAKTFLQAAGNINPADINVTIAIANPSAGGQLASAQSRDLVTVTVSVPFSRVSYLPPTFLTSANLTGISSMRHE